MRVPQSDLTLVASQSFHRHAGISIPAQFDGDSDLASVRYIVNDIDESVAFYRDRLGFTVEKHNPGKFAALKLEDLHLFINAPGAGSAGKAGGDPSRAGGVGS